MKSELTDALRAALIPMAASEGLDPLLPTRRALITSLFDALNDAGIRYCVLHSWEDIPDNVEGDLDIAVHPDDKASLKLVLRILSIGPYVLVQAVNYFTDAYAFVFSWTDENTIHSFSIDVIFTRQRGLAAVPLVKTMLKTARRYRAFWVVDPESEFIYLLAKKSTKGTASDRQQRRLLELVTRIGESKARSLARHLCIGGLEKVVVEACRQGTLQTVLRRVKRQAPIAALVRNPAVLAATAFRECARLTRRWIRTEGLLVAVMGVDGSGKSTMIDGLTRSTYPLFNQRLHFHWRPGIVLRRSRQSDAATPHARAPHGAVKSSVRLILYVLDFWLGYWSTIRPCLAHRGLVIFDRYFDDIGIDPKRYRFGGPQALVKLCSHLVPQADVTLLLDCPEDVVLARKQEVSPEEVSRLRHAYCQHAIDKPGSRVIDAQRLPNEVIREASTVILDLLARRTVERHRVWLGSKTVTEVVGAGS